MRSILAAGLVSGLALIGIAGAQQRPTEIRKTTTTTEIRKGSVVIGANVVVQGGATVGRITDFVIDEGGCIDYVVVSYENSFVLVPWGVVTINPAQRIVQVNVTQEKFREVPTFTGTNWPVTDQQYIQKVRTAFGTTERRQERREERKELPPAKSKAKVPPPPPPPPPPAE